MTIYYNFPQFLVLLVYKKTCKSPPFEKNKIAKKIVTLGSSWIFIYVWKDSNLMRTKMNDNRFLVSFLYETYHKPIFLKKKKTWYA